MSPTFSWMCPFQREVFNENEAKPFASVISLSFDWGDESSTSSLATGWPSRPTTLIWKQSHVPALKTAHISGDRRKNKSDVQENTFPSKGMPGLYVATKSSKLAVRSIWVTLVVALPFSVTPAGNKEKQEMVDGSWEQMQSLACGRPPTCTILWYFSTDFKVVWKAIWKRKFREV